MAHAAFMFLSLGKEIVDSLPASGNVAAMKKATAVRLSLLIVGSAVMFPLVVAGNRTTRSEETTARIGVARLLEEYGETSEPLVLFKTCENVIGISRSEADISHARFRMLQHFVGSPHRELTLGLAVAEKLDPALLDPIEQISSYNLHADALLLADAEHDSTGTARHMFERLSRNPALQERIGLLQMKALLVAEKHRPPPETTEIPVIGSGNGCSPRSSIWPWGGRGTEETPAPRWTVSDRIRSGMVQRLAFFYRGNEPGILQLAKRLGPEAGKSRLVLDAAAMAKGLPPTEE